MSKQSLTLSTAARSAIVSSFVNALSQHESTGSLVTQVCETARKYLKGAAISAEDRAAIVSDIAKARGWKGSSLRSRTSEVNVVLKAYNTLPEAIEMYRAKAKRVQWHDSMKLARRLNAGDTIAQAVRAVLTKGSSKQISPSGRVAGALKAWLKAEPRKQKVILEAAALLGLKLGVKLDA